MSLPSVGFSQRLRQSTGITRSFVIIVASAILDTITMAVAADRPPRKAMMASDGTLLVIGSVSTRKSGLPAGASPAPRPASTTGTTSTVKTAR